jgi:uncharacterized protein (TIGR03000 family)
MLLARQKRARWALCIGAIVVTWALPIRLAIATADPDKPVQKSPVLQSALLTLYVPPDALVSFDGVQTSQRGLSRRFMTEPLTPGREYSYEISVSWVEDSRAVVRKRRVTFWAGERIMLDIGSPAQATTGTDSAATTSLGTSFYYNPRNQPDSAASPRVQLPDRTGRPGYAALVIRVPADAEILFDGVITTQKGTRRLFITPTLRAGTKYHYEIVARWQQDGQTVRKSRQVEVSAGASISVNFVESEPAKTSQK